MRRVVSGDVAAAVAACDVMQVRARMIGEQGEHALVFFTLLVEALVGRVSRATGRKRQHSHAERTYSGAFQLLVLLAVARKHKVINLAHRA